MKIRKLVDTKSPPVQCGRTEGKGSNTFAACMDVLFIQPRSMTGLVRKNIALLLSLTPGGMTTVNIQSILFNQNSIKPFGIYAYAGRQLLA